MSDLVTLARKFVDLSDQLEATRGEIAKAVLNGGGGATPKAPFVPAGRPGRTGSQSQSQKSQEPQSQESPSQESQPKLNHIEVAKLAEETILALLAAGPKRMAEISAEMSARQSTTSERLRRLKEKGLIRRDGEGWAASAAPGP